MIVFGGSGGSYRNDTWVLELGQAPRWRPLATFGTPPSPRRQLSAIHDPVRDRMIIYGGFDEQLLGDVWALELSGAATWVMVTPAGTPPVARAGHRAIYDPEGDRMIVFGGYDGASPTLRRNDVWELSFSGAATWTELHPAGTPPAPRSSHTVAYDAPRQRMLLFGGTAPNHVNDVWALALSPSPAWAELTPAVTAPHARESHSAIYEPLRHRMVVFGGDDGMQYHQDAWAFALTGTPEWKELAPGGEPPTRRWGHATAYDPPGLRMVIFGGYDWQITGSTWALTWDEPVPVELADFEVTSADGEARLTWRTLNERHHLGFNVHRADEADGAFRKLNGSLVTREPGPANSSATYLYIDRDTEPERVYWYQLEAIALNGETQRFPACSVRITRTAPVQLALHPNRPDPFNPATAIRFDLPVPMRVELAIYDAAGRWIATLVDDRLEPGAHTAAWNGVDHRGRPVGSGVYMARLVAGQRVLTEKLVLAK